MAAPHSEPQPEEPSSYAESESELDFVANLEVRWSGDAIRTRKCNVRVYAGEPKSAEIVDGEYIQPMHVEMFDGTAAWAGVLEGEGALATPSAVLELVNAADLSMST